MVLSWIFELKGHEKFSPRAPKTLSSDAIGMERADAFMSSDCSHASHFPLCKTGTATWPSDSMCAYYLEEECLQLAVEQVFSWS